MTVKAKTAIENGILPTLCRQCNMRCGLNIHIANGKIAEIRGNKAHPQYRGGICARGRVAAELAYHPDRLHHPLKRMPDGSFSKISHEQAMDEISQKMLGIRDRYGARAMAVWTGEAIGFYQQADYARRFIHAFGSPNYTSADSLCFSTRYISYLLVHGYFNPCPDFENADLIILWGTNPPVSHPPFMRSISMGRRKGAKLIVIDPRRTASARKADLFVQPLPGTDGALALGIAAYLIKNGEYDGDFIKKYSVGFEKFAEYVKRFTPEFVAQQTGIDRARVVDIARIVSRNRPKVVNFAAIALEHHENAFNNIRAVACLRGLCGAIDIRGGDPWPEGMGGRKLTLQDNSLIHNQNPVGADKYPVFNDFLRESHSMTVIDYMLGQGSYPLRGLIVTGANPVLTNPNAMKVAKAFAGLELLVSRELFMTQTARLAHYVLPAASFLERSELHYHSHLQMVTLTNKVLDIPGVQDEYTFWRDLAHRIGLGDEYFPWQNEEHVNRWILEPTNISIDELKKHPEGYVYKPYREKKFHGQPFPTPSGKFEFVSQYLKDLGYPEFPEYKPPRYLSRPEKDYPLVLITGARKSLYLHSRYRNIDRFRAAVPAAEVEIHPIDASKLEIDDKEWVRIISHIGSIEIQVKIVPQGEILPGIIQITHGWDEANVNFLTDDKLNDPVTGFPLLKAIQVRIEKTA